MALVPGWIMVCFSLCHVTSVDMSTRFKSTISLLLSHGVSLCSPGFLFAQVAVSILNGIKQDNTFDLPLGQHIMIGTNPRWQMTALLALWIDGFRARVHYCECVVQFVERCGKKKSIFTRLLFLFNSVSPC